jgi:Asp-tRNA(Asn)/Glu-tRNA(Gln) amidotransferase A subunit family amidase
LAFDLLGSGGRAKDKGTTMSEMLESLSRLTAAEASARLRAGDITSEQLARACLARIAPREADVQAWSYLDPDAVIRQARELDKLPSRGPLHGVPVGLKDIFDTADMPTQHNSPIYTGHRPNADAAAVGTLRAAGMLIFGKTDTTEFAGTGRLAATRNPHDISRTPGGSSSGSAAAVADFHVPLALGTQTGGSLIRPGSFCGIYAMKPTWNAVSAEGVKLGSTTLDTPGWYGRSVADLALLADVFSLEDDHPADFPSINGARIAVHPTPHTVEDASRDALEKATERLAAAGAKIVRLDLAEIIEPMQGTWEIVACCEGRAAFLNLARLHPHLLHKAFLDRVNNIAGFTRADLVRAHDTAARCRVLFDEIARGFDGVLTLSAPGEAPRQRTQGDNVLNRDWTLLHVPCINIPAGLGPNGMPVGLTLTGPRYADRRLLALSAVLAPVVDQGSTHRG